MVSIRYRGIENSPAFDNNLLHGLVLVLLVRYMQLLPADDLVARDLLPLGAADEVLSLEERVPEDFGVRGRNDELVCRHGFPHLLEEGAIVDLPGQMVSLDHLAKRGRHFGSIKRTRRVVAMQFFSLSQSLES